MKKPNVFNLSTLSPERSHAIRNTCIGSYTFDFRGTSPERLDQMSKNFPRPALEYMTNHFVIFESFYEDGNRRLKPIPEQFPENMRELFAGGSFSKYAVFNSFPYYSDNSLFNYGGFCLDCGARLKTPDGVKNHKCGEKLCDCGARLKTTDEKKYGVCIDCATKKAAKVWGYHGRPHRNNPLFEKPEKRNTLLHIGAEIEIGGENMPDGIESANVRELSAIANADPFRPFIEFENDSSIEYGVECITRPLTFDGYKKRADALRRFYEYAVEIGGGFNKVNGLHFHVDRNFFKDENDPERPTKAAIFIDFMIYKYFDFWAAICRRKDGAFGYAGKKHEVKSFITAATSVNYHDHCNAVNGGGSYTIEFRFFGGKIDNSNDFFAALDLVQAVARWAKYATLTSAEKATPNDIIKYIKDKQNVLQFVANVRADRPTTTAGESMRADFIKALSEKIESEKGGK